MPLQQLQEQILIVFQNSMIRLAKKMNTADSDNRSSLIDNRYSQIIQGKNKRVAD